MLARGYAVVYREGRRAPLLSAAQVRIGDRIRVRLSQGQIGAVVREGGAPGAGPGPLFTEEE